MWELRWILVALGVAVVAGIYGWYRLPFRLRLVRRMGGGARASPNGLDAPPAPEDAPARQAAAGPKKVITLRFVPRNGGGINAEQAVLALRAAGLEHGRYGIFHFPMEADRQQAEFSVASLIEPGSFDLSNLEEQTLPGMSFFMVLPGGGDPIGRFDRMVGVARKLKRFLDAELFDDQGSSWSIQRERYVREEIIEYCHQTRG